MRRVVSEGAVLEVEVIEVRNAPLGSRGGARFPVLLLFRRA